LIRLWSKQKHKRTRPQRFYRCRGIVACRGTQVIAGDIEHSVLLWLQAPKRRQLSAEAGYVLSTMKPLWRVFLPPTLRSIVQKLVAQVRWDGRREKFQVVLDESALRLQAAELRKARSAAP
jgi:hypothetical protein